VTVTLYHNPRCSKSRAALKLLDERGVTANVVDYQKTPPTRDELQQLLTLLGLSPRELMRTQESAYREAHLDNPRLGDDELIDAIITHPILLQRPIAVAGRKAAIGRPPENILNVL